MFSILSKKQTVGLAAAVAACQSRPCQIASSPEGPGVQHVSATVSALKLGMEPKEKSKTTETFNTHGNRITHVVQSHPFGHYYGRSKRKMRTDYQYRGLTSEYYGYNNRRDDCDSSRTLTTRKVEHLPAKPEVEFVIGDFSFKYQRGWEFQSRRFAELCVYFEGVPIKSSAPTGNTLRVYRSRSGGKYRVTPQYDSQGTILKGTGRHYTAENVLHYKLADYVHRCLEYYEVEDGVPDWSFHRPTYEHKGPTSKFQWNDRRKDYVFVDLEGQQKREHKKKTKKMEDKNALDMRGDVDRCRPFTWSAFEPSFSKWEIYLKNSPRSIFWREKKWYKDELEATNKLFGEERWFSENMHPLDEVAGHDKLKARHGLDLMSKEHPALGEIENYFYYSKKFPLGQRLRNRLSPEELGTYQSEDDSTIWVFSKTKRTFRQGRYSCEEKPLVWLSDVFPANSEITRFGVRSQYWDLGPIQSKAIEYESQILGYEADQILDVEGSTLPHLNEEQLEDMKVYKIPIGFWNRFELIKQATLAIEERENDSLQRNAEVAEAVTARTGEPQDSPEEGQKEEGEGQKE